MLGLGILLVGCLGKVSTVSDSFATLPTINWKDVNKESTDILSAYLQVDTTNPPGIETNGTQFLAEILDKEGIEYAVYESSPNRGNLVARIRGSGEEQPICLLSHIDVVSVEAEKWSKPPFSGIVEDGYIWGRGALDMKSMTVMELMTMLLLHRMQIPLRRDVILLAVADEEVGGEGIQFLRDNHWGDIGCSHVINEGGLGLHDMMFAGQTVYPISVGEKGNVWLKMIAMGEPGHGSTPRPNEAPVYLLDAIDRLKQRDLDPTFSLELEQLVVNIGGDKGGATGFVLRNHFLRNHLVLPKMMENPITRASLINTVHITGLGGEKQPNVVPSEVYAILDCRIQPDVDPQEFIQYLQSLVGEHIRFEVIEARKGSISSTTDPLFEALMYYATAGEENSVAGPVISVGFTDSNYLRPLGVQAYGFVPISLTAEEMAGFHGHNEKISIEDLEDGTRKLFSSVFAVSAK